MLGFSQIGAMAVSSSTFGSVSTNFIMDDVQCDGTEETLEDCSYNPRHNCGSSEGAGVICKTEAYFQTTTTTTTTTTTSITTTTITTSTTSSTTASTSAIHNSITLFGGQFSSLYAEGNVLYNRRPIWYAFM